MDDIENLQSTKADGIAFKDSTEAQKLDAVEIDDIMQAEDDNPNNEYVY